MKSRRIILLPGSIHTWNELVRWWPYDLIPANLEKGLEFVEGVAGFVPMTVDQIRMYFRNDDRVEEICCRGSVTANSRYIFKKVKSGNFIILPERMITGVHRQ